MRATSRTAMLCLTASPSRPRLRSTDRARIVCVFDVVLTITCLTSLFALPVGPSVS
jgi:hypothetical protein